MQHDPWQLEIERSRTSRRWAALGFVALFVAVLGAFYLFVEHYYGDDGVRVVGIVAGVLFLIILIIAIGYAVNAIAAGMNMRHHDNILRGLVAFQREDDRGEVARTVASGITGVLRSSNQLDSRLLTTANQIARQQTRYMLEAQQREEAARQVETERSWYEAPAASAFEDDWQ